MIQALLVDDEPMAVANLKHILMFFPCISVIGSCTVPEDALEFCVANEVDVVFLDIEMPRIKGLELAGQIQRIRPDTLFVFITAYRDYAINAFEINAQDYLLKPVTQERMAIAVEKVQKQIGLRQDKKIDQPERLSGSDSISGKADGRIYRLEIKDIYYFSVEGRAVSAVTARGVYRLQGSLAHWESRLSEQLFLRCHSGYIVNLSKIEYVEPFFKNSYTVKLIGCEEAVPVSRSFAKRLKELVRR